jgi:hypothetical protein
MLILSTTFTCAQAAEGISQQTLLFSPGERLSIVQQPLSLHATAISLIPSACRTIPQVAHGIQLNAVLPMLQEKVYGDLHHHKQEFILYLFTG